jgi:hypothetical protein
MSMLGRGQEQVNAGWVGPLRAADRAFGRGHWRHKLVAKA